MDKAKLFANGRSQAVRLPREFRFPGKTVYIKRLGAGVVLLPETYTWDTLFEGLSSFEPGFRIDRDQPKRAQRRTALK